MAPSRSNHPTSQAHERPEIAGASPPHRFRGDDELQRAYRSAAPSRQAIVELKLRDGPHPPPSHQSSTRIGANPMIVRGRRQCFALMAPVLGKKRARSLIDTVWNIGAGTRRSLAAPLAEGVSSAVQQFNAASSN